MQHRCIRSIKRTGTFGTFLHTSTTLDTSRRVTEYTVIDNRNSRYGAYIDTIFALRTQVLIRHWSLRRGRAFHLVGKITFHLQRLQARKFVHLFELLLDGTSEPDGSFMIGLIGTPGGDGHILTAERMLSHKSTCRNNSFNASS